jgi:hypothetical protein
MSRFGADDVPFLLSAATFHLGDRRKKRSCDMRRVMLVSAGVLYGCLGPVQEGLEPLVSVVNGSTDDGGDVNRGEPYFVAGSGCGPSEPGDPEHLVHAGIYYRRPPCDVAAINRPSTAPALPLRGVDTPTPELDGVAQLMVGQWHGTQTSPWDGSHDVQLTLFENGRYSGTTSADTVLFYYGESCAAHRDFWRLEYGTSALAFGQIQMSDEIGLSCMTEEMRRIQVDAKTLRFELWQRGEYGPVTLDLQRVEVTP